MTKLTIIFLVVFLVGIIGAVPKRDRNDYTKNPYRIVCYFGSWANYHKIDPFKIEDIEENLCTHINYGFAKINEYTYEIEVFDPYLDDKKNTWDLRGYERFNNLRKKNPNLTTMIALGGWYEGSEKYSDMAKTPEHRERFVQSVLKFLKEYDFDGLDMDWEYPGSRKGDPINDKEHFITLMRELNDAFEEEGYVLTAAVSPGKKTIDLAYIVPELNKLLDWINVMAYDYHGGWEDFLGHNAPLYKRTDETDEISFWFNVNYTINYWLELGADKKNIVMGMPFYGRAWSLESTTKVKLHDEAKGMSPAGFISGEEGVLGYNEICQMEQKNPDAWTNTYDPYYNAPYAYNDEIWVGFDNLDSLSCKLAFLKKMGLSGGMVWSLENDDFMNRCGGGRYPLLHKVHHMLNGDGRHSYECKLGGEPTTPTTIPTTPTTTPTTPTTTPTTPTTTPTTPTTTPTTPTTTPTTPTTTPTTPTTTPTTPTTTPTTPTTTPTTPTTTPTTPTTTPTTPTTTPTTPTTTPTTPTTTPTTPTTTPTTPTTTPTTPTTTPTTPTTTPEPETSSVMITKEIDGVVVRCYKAGMIAHPTDKYKYVVCEYIHSGTSKGWWIHIMGCAPGTKWAQEKQECVLDA